MPAKIIPEAVISQLGSVLSVWSERPDLKIERQEADGTITEITYAEIADRQDKLKKKVEAITEQDRQLAVAKDERDDEARALSEIRSRGLSLVRAVFGANSPKYQQAGGTRTSERKSPQPKKKPVTP